MLKKMLAIALLATSLTGFNLHSQETGIQKEPILKAGIPIKFLEPPQATKDFFDESKDDSSEEEDIDSKSANETAKESYSYQSQIITEKPIATTPTQTAEAVGPPIKTKATKELRSKNYTIKDVIRLLDKTTKIDPTKASANQKLLEIRDEYYRLIRFPAHAKNKIADKKFNEPIEIPGIKDVTNIARDLGKIDPNDPWADTELMFIEYKIDSIKNILQTLENLILKKQIKINREKGTPAEFIFKEEEEKVVNGKEISSAEAILFPYPSILTRSIKSDPKLIQKTIDELTRRIKGLLTTIRGEDIDFARNSILRFLKNYGLIIWGPETQDPNVLKSDNLSVYNPVKVNAKFTEKYINTLDKIALEEYLIYLIDQLTKTRTDLFEELIQFKERLK